MSDKSLHMDLNYVQLSSAFQVYIHRWSVSVCNNFMHGPENKIFSFVYA